jgi:hypothetical protein
MLLDTLTLALAIQAQNQIAARQLLSDLLLRTTTQLEHIPAATPDPVWYYQRQVVLKACAIAQGASNATNTEAWLQELY